MKITQAVFGVFHHFDLARELEARGHLQAIYSTFPWARLKREGIAREKVKTFPWIHTPEYLLNRAGLLPSWLMDETGYLNALAFDEWTNWKIGECDAFIAISGAGLKTGQRLQRQGAKFICDRGSTHARFQTEIVEEEQRRWGVNRPANDVRDTVREETIYAACDALTVPSEFARQTYIDRGIPAEKVHVIPYGVRLERFMKTQDAPAERFEVLFVGGVSLRKGIPYLLEAFARLKAPNKRLRIVGGMADWMKPVLERLPREHVEFAGSVPQHQLPTIMSSSHVLVLPSIEDGFGMVMTQALACGCPVIGTNNTGASDTLTDGVEGYIVPIRDADTLADRLQRLANGRELQRRMSEAALERVKGNGGWTGYGDAWEKLLRKLTGAA
jgi:glycosyltransferase involved in cell wall biosynthesis